MLESLYIFIVTLIAYSGIDVIIKLLLLYYFLALIRVWMNNELSFVPIVLDHIRETITDRVRSIKKNVIAILPLFYTAVLTFAVNLKSNL
jgi:hypothetical protein